MKLLKHLNKKDRKFINYRASHNNPRETKEERLKFRKNIKKNEALR